MSTLLTEGGIVEGKVVGNPVNDCYGSLTAAIATEITRIIPPHPTARACVGSWSYLPAGTAHLLTLMVTVAETIATSEAAAGQAVVAFGSLPDSYDGGQIAANDWVIMQHEDGTYGAYKVSSISGKNVTMSSNLTKKVLINTKIYFMGAPGDHVNRQFQTVASTQYKFDASDFRVRAATGRTGTPILFHSPNATAAGTLQHLNYYYD